MRNFRALIADKRPGMLKLGAQQTRKKSTDELIC
jgi:hypothetical protein